MLGFCTVSLMVLFRGNLLWVAHLFLGNILMLQVIKRLFVPIVMIGLMISPSNAQEVELDLIRQLVREEIERQLNTEVLDSAIEKGIERFILKQQTRVDQERIEQQKAQVNNLRPVNPYRDHIFGNPDAPVTMVEYSDFECPFCKLFHLTAIQLVKNNPHTLRWVYRHFPLEFHNPGAQQQAEASECVAELNGNDTFWAYSNRIYQRTRSNGKGFPSEKLRPLAEEVGVNGDTFSECMSSGRMTNRVEEDYENGVKVGVSGTPANIFTNQKGEMRVSNGAVSLEKLQALVDELSQ